MSAIVAGAQAVGNTILMIHQANDEKSCLQGLHAPLAVMAQTVQGFTTVLFAEHVFGFALTFPVSLAVKGSIAVISIGLGVIVGYDLLHNYPLLQKIAVTLHENMGTIYRVAYFATCIAMIAFGQVIPGTICLAIFAIGFLDRHGYLPHMLERILHESLSILGPIAGIITGEWLAKIGSGIELLGVITSPIFKWLTKKGARPVLEAYESKLSPAQLKSLYDYAPTEIDKAHIGKEITPQINLKPIRTLLTLWDGAEWGDHLKDRLNSDERIRREYGDVQDLVRAKEIARGHIEKLIEAIEKKQFINGGKIWDFESLQKDLEAIAGFLEGKNSLTITSALEKLAIEAGEYCSSGVIKAVKQLKLECLTQFGTFHQKVYLALQFYRDGIFQQGLAHLSRVPVLNEFTTNVHWYNLYANLYGTNFGISDTGQSEEQVMEVPALAYYALSMQRWSLEAIFFQTYTDDNIVTAIEEAFDTGLLTQADFYNQWVNEYADQHSEEGVEYDTLENCLIVSGEKYSLESANRFRIKDDKPIIDSRFIKAMLIDYGILKMNEKPAEL